MQSGLNSRNGRKSIYENFSRDSRGVGTGCSEPFRRIKENADIFSGGESRHWVHTASPCKENGGIDENISRGETVF